MKKIKNFSILITILAILFPIVNVNAGTCNFKVEGQNKVVVGNNIDLTISTSDILGANGGLSAIQGDVIFDKDYLTYVQNKKGTTDLTVSYGTNYNRFVGVGLNGEYIAKQGNLLTLTFKAEKVGTTKVTINNIKAADLSNDAQNVTVIDKEIEIVKASNTGGSSNSSSGTTNSVKGKTQKTVKSSDNDLASLTVNNAKMLPTFHKNVTSYSITIPNDVTKLDLLYTLSNTKAKAEVKGNENLKEGENKVEIIVTAEDGSKKTYILNVTRTKSESSNKLKSLKVKESNLHPKFNPDKNEYKVRIKKDIKKLTINAIAKDKESTVEIIDNEKLDKGNSVVLIKVTDKNGFSNYYKLKVNNTNIVTLFGINVLHIIYGLLFTFFLILIFFVLLKRNSDNKVAESLIDLYDDVVTPEEIVYGFKAYALENDPSKLQLLIKQNNTNKEKEKVAKDELVEAMANNDKEKIKKIKAEIASMKGNLTEEEEELRDALIKAIEDKDSLRIKQMMRIIRNRRKNK